MAANKSQRRLTAGRPPWLLLSCALAVVATTRCVAPRPSSAGPVRPPIASPPDVPAAPPDSVPAWLYADSSLTSEPGMSDRFMRGVILIRFQRTASPRDRRAAIAAVHGVVIGGRRFADQPGDGFYLVRLPATSPNADLFAAIAALNRMPYVRYATVDAVRTGG